MKKYYLIFNNNNNLIDAVEERYEGELWDYFEELERKSYHFKEVSHFKYRMVKENLWRILSNPKDLKEIKRTYFIAEIPTLLKLVILIAVINLIFILS